MIPKTLRILSDRRLSNMDDLKKNVALLFVLVAFFLYAGCASNQAMTRAGTPPSGSKPPVITNYFAPRTGIQGDTIKIYLAAGDPDGDMRDIGTQITQVGYGV